MFSPSFITVYFVQKYIKLSKNKYISIKKIQFISKYHSSLCMRDVRLITISQNIKLVGQNFKLSDSEKAAWQNPGY